VALSFATAALPGPPPSQNRASDRQIAIARTQIARWIDWTHIADRRCGSVTPAGDAAAEPAFPDQNFARAPIE